MTDILLASGWSEAPASLLFGEMVKRAVPRLEGYHSDLWHDAQTIEDILPAHAKHAAPIYWVVRPFGTHLYGWLDWGEGAERQARSLLRTASGVVVYKIVVRKDSAERWLATFDTIAVS